jgi:hypothetical protein
MEFNKSYIDAWGTASRLGSAEKEQQVTRYTVTNIVWAYLLDRITTWVYDWKLLKNPRTAVCLYYKFV